MGFSDGMSIIELAGVAKRAGGPLWRRVVWGVILAAGVVYSQGVAVLLGGGMAWLALVLFAGIMAGVVGMVVSGKRHRRSGAEIFSITPDGFGRREVRGRSEQTDFVLWGEGTPVFKIERIGSVWSRIKLGVRAEGGGQRALLNAGFRCSSEDLDVLGALIARQLRGEGMDDLESVPGYRYSVFDLDERARV